MDSSAIWTTESSQMPDEGYSEDDAQALSELLAKNLRNLTLNPSTTLTPLPPESSPEKQERGRSLLGLSPREIYGRRHGVRTLASVRKERMRRMLQVIRIRTLSLLQKDPEERKRELEARARKFRCTCRYCRYHGDPTDNISMEDNYDMESI